MKKLILLFALAFVMCGCANPVGESTLGKRMAVPIEKGATRLTITTDYIIVETCDGHKGFERPFWKCDKIFSISNDSIQEELIRKIKKQ